MVNAFLIQLYIPAQFLGCAVPRGQAEPDDLDRMFALLGKREARWPTSGRTGVAVRDGVVRFERVSFGLRATAPVSCMRRASRFRPARRWRLSGARAPGKKHVGALL